ncbi:MAG: hypothetical protein ACKO3P_16065 [Planctomycetaceae bacterium]
MRNLPLAPADSLLAWGTSIWAAVAIRKHYRRVALPQVRCFIGVSIATALQLSITASYSGRCIPPAAFPTSPETPPTPSQPHLGETSASRTSAACLGAWRVTLPRLTANESAYRASVRHAAEPKPWHDRRSGS